MWELDHKEGWSLKNWCLWTVVLEKTLESPLDNKEIKPVNPKENQAWVLIGRTDAEAEAPILWLPNAKSLLIGKDHDAEKDWRQEDKGAAEDGTVGWHHWLNRCEFELAPGDGEGQGRLPCCNPWGRKKSDTIERLKKNSNTSHMMWGRSGRPWERLQETAGVRLVQTVHVSGHKMRPKRRHYLFPRERKEQ